MQRNEGWEPGLPGRIFVSVAPQPVPRMRSFRPPATGARPYATSGSGLGADIQLMVAESAGTLTPN